MELKNGDSESLGSVILRGGQNLVNLCTMASEIWRDTGYTNKMDHIIDAPTEFYDKNKRQLLLLQAATAQPPTSTSCLP